MRSMQ